MGIGRLKTLAFLNKAVVQKSPATRWSNPTLDHTPIIGVISAVGGGAEGKEKENNNKNY